MNKVKLHTDRITEIQNIIHVADVHIRNLKRHDEYQSVFQKLYDECRAIVSENKNTIIYLAGDIVHAKTDMSPELVLITRQFFSNLCDIAPVVLILGNHDCMLTNPNRLDALTPIVNSMNEYPDFFFLKDTGIYELFNVDFTVNSVYDEPENFISGKYKTDNVKIVLFHGAVDNAYTTDTMRLQNNKIKNELFDGFDFGLFGDIHKMQYMDTERRLAYPGSLIQQNFGEELIHGFMLWDIKNKTSKFIPIENEWAYHTIDIEDGRIINMPQSFATNNRIRLRAKNTSNSDLSLISTKIRNIANVSDIRIQRISDKNSAIYTQMKSIPGDIRDVEYQNKLITDYVTKKFSISSDIIDEIHKINRNVNSLLTDVTHTRNSVWKPIRFEFSNMFSYAEDNYIDFEKMTGTYGIFAPNASGKSSILDAITFCIFDKCSRTFKASKIMNNKKDTFYCKLEFEMNGVRYFIERNATKNKQGIARVAVNFWYLNSNDEKISLNGEDRDATNSNIRNYLGTYDDFIITALSVQGNNTNFIDKQQRERKDLLAQFLDLNLFEELSSIATNEIKGVQTLIKEYSKKNYGDELIESKNQLKDLCSQLDSVKEKQVGYEKELHLIDEQILSTGKQIVKIDDNLTGNYENETSSIKRSMAVLEKRNSELELTKHDIQKNIHNNQEKINSIKIELSKIDVPALEKKIKIADDNQIQRSKLFTKLYANENEISIAEDKVSKLNEHEYDPKCKHCCNNIFVKDARNAIEHLPKLILNRNVLQAEVDKFPVDVIDGESVDDMRDALKTVKYNIEQISNIERQTQSLKSSLLKIDSELQNNIHVYENNKQILEKYERNKNSLINNAQIEDILEKLNLKKREIRNNINSCNSSIVSITASIAVHDSNIKNYVTYINKLKELEIQYRAYDYYLRSVGRDGIPYELIANALPKIQSEVNGILNQVVDFQVLFDTDGKNINAYIVYDDDNFWPLEMTSGMEKFVSSLSIRAALINITSLPKPNFIAIDEGWGTLDSDNLNSLTTLFDYLKSQFDFVLTISHIDSLRDIVNSTIDIQKKNGNSKLNYEEN
ncbi:AAA domain containing protein [Microcystis phage Mel-JY01]